MPDSEKIAWWRRLYRWAYWLPRDARSFLRYGRPDYLVYFGGRGWGDDLLLGTVLYELRLRGVRRIAVASRLEDLFLHAPFADTRVNEQWRTLEAMRRFGGTVAKPIYYARYAPPEYDVPATTHIITTMCRTAGIRGRVALRTYLQLTPAERARAPQAENQVVIQCTGTESLNFSPLKHWYSERYQEVVDKLRHRVQFVQIGAASDPALKGVVDLRGKTSVRESAAILANSRLCITYVGFLMHLARAVDTRSVVIFGGRERPDQSGYICNENLYTDLPCAPCWRRSTSLHDRDCMARISSDDVVAAVERSLAKGDLPLETAYEDVQERVEEFPLPWISASAPSPST